MVETDFSFEMMVDLVGVLENKIKHYCQANRIEYKHTDSDTFKRLMDLPHVPPEIKGDLSSLIIIQEALNQKYVDEGIALN